MLSQLLRTLRKTPQSIMCDAIACNELESLFLVIPPWVLASFTAHLCGNSVGLVCDSRGSHVFEALLKAFPPSHELFALPIAKLVEHDRKASGDLGSDSDSDSEDSYSDSDDDDEDVQPGMVPPLSKADKESLSMKVLMQRFLTEWKPLMAQLVTDASGSHVIRTVIELAADKQTPNDYQRETLDNVWGALQRAYPQFAVAKLCLDPYGAPLLQMLIKAFAASDEAKTHLLTRRALLASVEGMDDGDSNLALMRNRHIAEMLDHEIGSHTLESLIQHASPDTRAQVWSEALAPHLGEALASPRGNYVIQSLIKGLNPEKEADLCNTFVDSLSPAITDMMDTRGGVLVALFELIARMDELGAPVDDAVKDSIIDQLGSWGQIFNENVDDKKKVHWIAFLVAEQGETREETLASPSGHYLGSRMAQAMLRWNTGLEEKNPAPGRRGKDAHLKMSPIAEPLADLPVSFLVSLACSSAGSFVIDAFTSSPAVPRFLKGRMATSFIPHVVQLLDDKFGSRIVENLYDTVGMRVKELMVRAFADHEPTLGDSYFGRHILRRAAVRLFKTRPEAWAQQQRAREASGGARDYGNAGQSGKRKRYNPGNVPAPYAGSSYRYGSDGTSSKRKKRKSNNGRPLIPKNKSKGGSYRRR